MRSRGILLACAAALALGACASGRGASVTDIELTRVPPEKLTAVQSQRLVVESAQDMVARRELGLESARNDARLAEQEGATAKADLPRVKQAVDKANHDRDAEAGQRAEQELRALSARREAADAHVRAANAAVKLAEARQVEARRQLELAQADLEWDKFAALQSARDPAVQQINSSTLLRRLRLARLGVRDAADEVARRQADFDRGQQLWRASAQRYQVLRGYGGAGAGGPW